MHPRPPKSTLFPYTTLFRSNTFSARRRSSRGRRGSCNEWIDGATGRRGEAETSIFAALPILPVSPSPHLPVVSFARHDADRKSTRLNSSHITITYAVFCLKK